MTFLRAGFPFAIAAAIFLSSPNIGAAKPPGCTGAEYRSFDYAVGTWLGRNTSGQVRGKAEVTQVLDGCSIRMHWTGRTYEGTNNNSYDATRHLWQKAWFDNTGGIELSEGHIVNKALVYRGVDYDHDKIAGMHRESWIPLPDGRMLEKYEVSSDRGATWTIAFETFYTRVDRATYLRTVILQNQ